MVVVGLLGFGANSAYGWYTNETQLPASDQSQKVAFKIAQGESSSEIGDDLFAKGLIRSREAWTIYVKLNNLAPGFQAGDYTLNKHMSMEEITAALQHARTDQVSFTIPEGYTISRTAARWEAAGYGKAQDYLDAANPANWQSYDFVAQRPKVAGRADNLEGYLLPETYSLNKGATARDLVKAQLDEFQRTVNADLKAKIASSGQTVDKIVIIRLAIPNTLDVDATVLYALGRTSGSQSLSNADLAAAAGSPYDTYTHQGLPPGPISNPGKAAINACVSPQQREQGYLFYFADCKGQTHFAHTNGEFDALKKQYGVVGDGC